MIKGINIWMVLFFVLLGVFLVRECQRPEFDPEVVLYDTLIGSDKEPYFVNFPVYYPKPYKVELPAETLFKDVDSTAILEQCMAVAMDYYSKKYYDHILMDDSASAFIRLKAHTHENELFLDSLTFQNYRPRLIKETKIIERSEKARLYFGAGTGYNFNSIDLTAGALLTFPNRLAVSYNRGLRTDYNYFSIYYSFGGRRGR
jgi:hypothetical protein